MIYLWLKAFHIAGAIVWLGGLLVAALVIMSRPAAPEPHATAALRIVHTVRRWDRCVTVPAMLLVWTLGLLMAVQGHWFSSLWLMLKLPCVLALSALHGVLSGLLRRHADYGDPAPSPVLLRYAAPIIPTLVLAVAILAVTKPF